MRLAQYLVPLWFVAILCGATSLRADEGSSVADDGSTIIDPNAIPRAFIPPKAPPTPQQVAAEKEARKKTTDNREWMLRGYAAQLKQRAKDGSNTGESQDYLTETADMAEATARALSDPDGTSDPNNPDASDPETTQIAGRSQSPVASPSPGSLITFKPLFSTDRPTAFLPFAAPSPIFSPNAPTLTADTDETVDNSVPKRDAMGRPIPGDSGDMDIPGMTAANSNPATRESMGLTDTDLLPGELSRADEKAHQGLELTLPLTRDLDRLDKAQSDATRVPGQEEKKPPVQAPPPPPETATENMVPDPSPVRAHVDDPFDILH